MNNDNEKQMAEEIIEDFGGDLEVSSWMDELGGLDLSGLEDDGIDLSGLEDVSDAHMSDQEILDIFHKILESNHQLVLFEEAYQDYTKRKLEDKFKTYQEDIKKLSKGIGNSMVDRSMLTRIQEAQIRFNSKGSDLLAKDLWDIIQTLPEGYKESMTLLVDKVINPMSGTDRLSEEHVNLVRRELKRFESIVTPNLRMDGKDNEVNLKSFGGVKLTGKMEEKILSEDIDVIYSLNTINRYEDITGRHTKDVLDCSRAYLNNLELTQGTIDLKYPENLSITVPPNYLATQSLGIRVVNRGLWDSMGIKEENSTLYILPFIKVNKLLIVIGDITVYNEIMHNLNKQLDEITLNAYGDDINYIKVADTGESLSMLTRVREDNDYHYKMYTNEELLEILKDSTTTREITDNVRTIFRPGDAVAVKNNTEEHKGKVAKSMFVTTMADIIKDLNGETLESFHNKDKSAIPRRLIGNILPRLLLRGQVPRNIADALYLMGDSAWFRNRMEEFPSEQRGVIVKEFLEGKRKDLFQDVTVVQIMSISPPLKKSQEMAWVECTVSALSDYQLILDKGIVEGQSKTITNVGGMLNYYLKEKLAQLGRINEKEKVYTLVKTYLEEKGLPEDQPLRKVSKVELTEEVKSIKMNTVRFALEHNDYSVLNKDNIPYVIANTIEEAKAGEDNIIELSNYSLETSDFAYFEDLNETLGIVKHILEGKEIIQRPIVKRVIDLMVTERLLDALENERRSQRMVNNADIIITDITNLSSLSKESKEINAYLEGIMSLLNILVPNNHKALEIFLAILNEEIMTVTPGIASEMIDSDLENYDYNKETPEYKEILELKIKELRLVKFIPLSFKQYEQVSKNYREHLFEFVQSAEKKIAKGPGIKKDQEKERERSNLSYRAYLMTGNESYLKDVDRDYVDVDLLIYESPEEGIYGEYSYTVLAEKYDIKDERKEIKEITDEGNYMSEYQYQMLILDIERMEPNLRYLLPKPVVDYVEDVQLIIPEGTFEFFMSGDSKFNITIKGR